MNAKTAVFAALSIKPHRIKELINKLPYSKHTIYKALKSLTDENLIEKRSDRGGVMVDISKRYTPQKLREIYVKALSFGIDPEMIVRKSTLAVWKQLAEPITIIDLEQDTGFSYLWVGNIIKFLVDSNLAYYIKRKPMVVILNEKHELNSLLKQYTGEKRDKKRIYYGGTIPFERLVKTPEEIEKILYDKIESSFTIKDTGFLIRGEDKLSVLESIVEEIELEKLFLREIKTVEGVEDFCIRLIAQGKLNYERLLTFAKEEDMVNVVGCYLDILSGIKNIIDLEVISKFQRNVTKRKTTFLKEEKKYGKGGWEDKYEEKWNVDLYLDIGAIRHGVRSI